MAADVSSKLTEILRLCSKNQIGVTLTQDGSKKNSIERIIEMDEDTIVIQINDENDENLLNQLDEVISSLTE